MRNLQEQVKKAFCYQKLFWPFTVWINCSSDLKNFANPRPSASNFKSFSQSLENLFLTVGQNNFGNKIPLQCKNEWRQNANRFFPFLGKRSHDLQRAMKPSLKTFSGSEWDIYSNWDIFKFSWDETIIGSLLLFEEMGWDIFFPIHFEGKIH